MGKTNVQASGKRQISAYINPQLLARLDAWIAWQDRVRGYETDRSHVINVLLARFLADNEPQTQQAD